MQAFNASTLTILAFLVWSGGYLAGVLAQGAIHNANVASFASDAGAASPASCLSSCSSPAELTERQECHALLLSSCISLPDLLGGTSVLTLLLRPCQKGVMPTCRRVLLAAFPVLGSRLWLDLFKIICMQLKGCVTSNAPVPRLMVDCRTA